MGRLAGKTCLVTGAAQGIGRSISEAFLAEGARVIATDLRPAALLALPDGERLIRMGLDVTQAEDARRAAAAHPDVNVLVNCAGYVAQGALLECTPEDFDRSLSINVNSIFTLTRAFLPSMLERKDGSIINIASVASSVMAPPNRLAYGASKAAVIGLTMSVARDYAAAGVRCNAISPGTVDTPSLHDRMAATGDAEAARRAFIARQLNGRLGTPEEVAAVAVLLASDEARFMTGANIVIDGGMSL
jgi:2-keto-3-deoxy-L-fuconate dehydrogenase